MIGVVLVTHGRLAVEFRSALEHVVGPQIQNHRQPRPDGKMIEKGPHPSPSPSPPGGAAVRVLEICNKKGLHARASAKFVQTVEQYDADVWVTRGNERVGGTSIMGLMM